MFTKPESPPPAMIFDDFELTITAAKPPDSGANLLCRTAQGQQRRGVFRLSTIAEAVAELNAAMHQPEPVQAVLERCGGQLFDALFAGKIGEAWRDAWTLARTRQHGVRLRLYPVTPALMAVPWEYLYDHEQGRWLTLHPELSLVRVLDCPSREPLPVQGMLRVLLMIAAPTDLPALNSEQEWARLQTIADATANLELIRIEPTYAALQAALRHNPHVFHFVGHGDFDAMAQQGKLAFCANGLADLVTADKLAVLLGSHPTLRLALLNACQGAQTGINSAFAGVAQQLIQHETPAVIAMQAPIVDDHALRFSQEFYAALADGMSVEEAVGQGRKRINEVTYTWGIPALYLQGQEPFAIPALSDTEKATHFWQKVQQLPEAASATRRRTLLEHVLNYAPTHAGAIQTLQRLNAAEKAMELYPAALAHAQQAEWRDAFRAFEQVEQLVPNFRDTRARLAEIRGKLAPPAPVSAAPDPYQPLLNALREGRLVPFLGWDVSRFGRLPQDGWARGKYLPSTEEAARELAGLLANRVEGAPSLLQIAQYTTLLEGDNALYQRLHELYTGPQQADYPPTGLHRLLAELPKRLRAKGYPTSADRRFVIFSTALDDLLERAFAAAEQPYHLFAYRHRYSDANGVTQQGRFFHTPPAGEPVEVDRPNEYNGHDGDRAPVIIKLCGQRITVDPDAPERVIITEDHFLEYLPTQTIGGLLPSTLLRHISGQNFVFFGHTFQPWHFRLLWQRMRSQNKHFANKSWAIAPNPTPLEEAFWASQKIVPLNVMPEDVVVQVNVWLDRLEPRG
ncbi:MAG: CHAT domain-containing protein [Caldilineaceae bacterium]